MIVREDKRNTKARKPTEVGNEMRPVLSFAIFASIPFIIGCPGSYTRFSMPSTTSTISTKKTEAVVSPPEPVAVISQPIPATNTVTPPTPPSTTAATKPALPVTPSPSLVKQLSRLDAEMMEAFKAAKNDDGFKKLFEAMSFIEKMSPQTASPEESRMAATLIARFLAFTGRSLPENKSLAWVEKMHEYLAKGEMAKNEFKPWFEAKLIETTSVYKPSTSANANVTWDQVHKEFISTIDDKIKDSRAKAKRAFALLGEPRKSVMEQSLSLFEDSVGFNTDMTLSNSLKRAGASDFTTCVAAKVVSKDNAWMALAEKIWNKRPKVKSTEISIRNESAWLTMLSSNAGMAPSEGRGFVYEDVELALEGKGRDGPQLPNEIAMFSRLIINQIPKK